jgi:hypothetical protein
LLFSGIRACGSIAAFQTEGEVKILCSQSVFVTSVRLHDDNAHDDEYIATPIGTISTSAGGGVLAVGALAVSSNGVVSTGQVVDSMKSFPTMSKASEVAKYWLADMIVSIQDTGFFLWGFQLANGRLLAWRVPWVNSLVPPNGLLSNRHSALARSLVRQCRNQYSKYKSNFVHGSSSTTKSLNDRA